jgi:hypothetical protein
MPAAFPQVGGALRSGFNRNDGQNCTKPGGSFRDTSRGGGRDDDVGQEYETTGVVDGRGRREYTGKVRVLDPADPIGRAGWPQFVNPPLLAYAQRQVDEHGRLRFVGVRCDYSDRAELVLDREPLASLEKERSAVTAPSILAPDREVVHEDLVVTPLSDNEAVVGSQGDVGIRPDLALEECRVQGQDTGGRTPEHR